MVDSIIIGVTDPGPGHEENLGALIARRLGELGMTQRALARALDVPPSTINAWVLGRRGGGGSIDPEKLRALAAALRLPVREVFEAAGRRAPGALDAEREAKLLRIYRNLNREGQRALIATAEAMETTMRAS